MVGRAGRCHGGPGAAGDLQGTYLSITGPQERSEAEPPGHSPPCPCPAQVGARPYVPPLLLPPLPDEPSASLVQTPLPQESLPPRPPTQALAQAPQLSPRLLNWSPHSPFTLQQSIPLTGTKGIFLESLLVHILPCYEPSMAPHCSPRIRS